MTSKIKPPATIDHECPNPGCKLLIAREAPDRTSKRDRLLPMNEAEVRIEDGRAPKVTCPKCGTTVTLLKGKVG